MHKTGKFLFGNKHTEILELMRQEANQVMKWVRQQGTDTEYFMTNEIYISSTHKDFIKFLKKNNIGMYFGYGEYYGFYSIEICDEEIESNEEDLEISKALERLLKNIGFETTMSGFGTPTYTKKECLDLHHEMAEYQSKNPERYPMIGKKIEKSH